jgi:hypothetical protein
MEVYVRIVEFQLGLVLSGRATIICFWTAGQKPGRKKRDHF